MGEGRFMMNKGNLFSSPMDFWKDLKPEKFVFITYGFLERSETIVGNNYLQILSSLMIVTSHYYELCLGNLRRRIKSMIWRNFSFSLRNRLQLGKMECRDKMHKLLFLIRQLFKTTMRDAVKSL